MAEKIWCLEGYKHFKSFEFYKQNFFDNGLRLGSFRNNSSFPISFTGSQGSGSLSHCPLPPYNYSSGPLSILLLYPGPRRRSASLLLSGSVLSGPCQGHYAASTTVLRVSKIQFPYLGKCCHCSCDYDAHCSLQVLQFSPR